MENLFAFNSWKLQLLTDIVILGMYTECNF